MPSIDEHNILTLLGERIHPGAKRTINFNMAKLYTTTSVDVPIIVSRAKKRGPCVLITAGIHGDEINGVEIVRQIIEKKINRPSRGTVICIPVLNVFGFINQARAFPDGRDLNRMFPGAKQGSLASRFAFQFVNKILPIADFCLDFHTGGAHRFNVAQVRVDPDNEELVKYARIFNAPFTVYSKNIQKSYRAACARLGKPVLLFEGGKSQLSDKGIAREGVFGAMRILKHLDMLDSSFEIPYPNRKQVTIRNSTWIRAKYSGLLHLKSRHGDFVEKGDIIATITDPYGTFRHRVKSSEDGYIININEASLVYQGDAIFHVSTDATIED